MSLLCKCGGKTHVRAGGDRRLEIDAALGQARRWRICTKCSDLFMSIELPQSEVAELRRRAHLYEMTVVKSQIDNRLETNENSAVG